MCDRNRGKDGSQPKAERADLPESWLSVGSGEPGARVRRKTGKARFCLFVSLVFIFLR